MTTQLAETKRDLSAKITELEGKLASCEAAKKEEIEAGKRGIESA